MSDDTKGTHNNTPNKTVPPLTKHVSKREFTAAVTKPSETRYILCMNIMPPKVAP